MGVARARACPPPAWLGYLMDASMSFEGQVRVPRDNAEFCL